MGKDKANSGTITPNALQDAKKALKAVIGSTPRKGSSPEEDESDVPSTRSQQQSATQLAVPQSFESAQEAINKVVENASKKYKPKKLSEMAHLISESQQGLKNSFDALNPSRQSIEDSIKALTTLLDDLDKFTDLKVGITRTLSEEQIAHIGSSEKSSVILRDARDQTALQAQSKQTYLPNILDKKEDVPESTVTIIVGQARGILKLIAIDPKLDAKTKKTMQREVVQSLKSYGAAIGLMSTQEARTKMTKTFNNHMAALIRRQGMEINGASGDKIKRKDLARAMVYARDFTNFEAKDSPTIVTITSNIAKDNTKPLYEVTASVPLKPVGKDLAQYYENLDTQPWFQSLSKIEQALVEQYKDKIIDGKHMIPTQLRELVGIKNGYLEQTSLIDNQGKTHDSAILVRSSTLAHNLGTGPDSLDITKKNMLYVQNLSGGRDLIIDTLNHNLGAMLSSLSADIRSERNIQKTMKTATKSFEVCGEGMEFHNHPISFSTTKTANIMNAADLYINANDDRAHTQGKAKKKILCVSCKSGKDRTGLIAHESTMSWIQSKFSSLLSKDANNVTAKASHQEELAARNTRGIFGLKVKTVLLGLRTRSLGWRKVTNIAKIGPLFNNQISYNNAVTLDQPSFFSRVKGKIKQIIRR